MELKEAVTILKTIDVIDLRELCDVTEEMYDEAICEVLEALEELQEENEKYRSGELLTANQVKSFEETTKKYYIHKDKIKEKLEEVTKLYNEIYEFPEPKVEETPEGQLIYQIRYNTDKEALRIVRMIINQLLEEE